MKLESIFVGKPTEVTVDDKVVETGIYKSRISGPVYVSETQIEGDGQADLSVHGGIDKAVYAYPAEHYVFWKAERDDLLFEPGVFGENLSVSGMTEDQVCVGDVFQVGAVKLKVTTPRMPCFKLGIKMGDPRFVKDFMQAEKNGFYLKVLQEGEIEAGDSIKKVEEDGYSLSILEMVQLYTTRKYDENLMRKAVTSPSLPEDWREYFRKRLPSG